jgi:hypothetical protein
MERLINEIINNSKNIEYPFEFIAPSKSKYIVFNIDKHFITYKLGLLSKKEKCNINFWSKSFLEDLLKRIQNIKV